MNNKQRMLFLLKKNGGYGRSYGNAPKAGLYNSAKMTAHVVSEKLDIPTILEVVADGNSVDRELHKWKPEWCVIEALWVTPQKLNELRKLHPHVTFIIRIHSEIAFLSNEGIAIEWIGQYSKMKNVFVAFNSSSTLEAFISSSSSSNTGAYIYLPNLYNERYSNYINLLHSRSKRVNIGCFGAIRPLKNQLIQAFAAIAWGNKYNKQICFHINSGRVEQGGESTLKNIRALFKNSPHTLIEHPWMDRNKFLMLVSSMDVGMQLSFTESFNIVAADFVSQHVPIVVSSTISWMNEYLQCSVDDVNNIVNALQKVYNNYFYSQLVQTLSLRSYNKGAIKEWRKNFKN